MSDDKLILSLQQAMQVCNLRREWINASKEHRATIVAELASVTGKSIESVTGTLRRMEKRRKARRKGAGVAKDEGRVR